MPLLVTRAYFPAYLLYSTARSTVDQHSLDMLAVNHTTGCAFGLGLQSVTRCCHPLC